MSAIFRKGSASQRWAQIMATEFIALENCSSFLKRPSHSLSELERYDAIAQRFLSLSTG